MYMVLCLEIGGFESFTINTLHYTAEVIFCRWACMRENGTCSRRRKQPPAFFVFSSIFFCKASDEDSLGSARRSLLSDSRNNLDAPRHQKRMCRCHATQSLEPLRAWMGFSLAEVYWLASLRWLHVCFGCCMRAFITMICIVLFYLLSSLHIYIHTSCLHIGAFSVTVQVL